MTIDLSEPRTQRAIYLAADSGQWLRCQSQTGERVWGIPSSQAGKFWLVTPASCQCPDFVRRGLPCKHVQALRLHLSLQQPVPAVRLVPTRVSEDEVVWDRAGRG